MKAILTLDFFGADEVNEDVLNDEISRVAAMLADGYTSGEILTEHGRGWWSLSKQDA